MPLPNPMNLFNGSRKQPVVDPNQQQPQPPNQQQQQPNANSLEKGAIKPGTQEQQAKDAAASPLVKFDKLWENDPAPEVKDKNSTQQQQQQNPVKKPSYSERAKQMDFARLISPDILNKATSGDATAWNTIFNTIGQSALAASMGYAEHHSTQSGKALEERVNSGLEGRWKTFSVQNQSIKQKALNNPVFKPLMDVIRQQINTKFPDATPEEINDMAGDYFQAMHEELGKEGKAKENAEATPAAGSAEEIQAAQRTGDFDWDKYVTGVSAPPQ